MLVLDRRGVRTVCIWFRVLRIAQRAYADMYIYVQRGAGLDLELRGLAVATIIDYD